MIDLSQYQIKPLHVQGPSHNYYMIPKKVYWLHATTVLLAALKILGVW